MMTAQKDIGRAIKSVLENVQRAVGNRLPGLPDIQPRVVAVSKTKPVECILAAYQHGHRHFGENYVQELDEKSTHTQVLENCPDIKWHFIGHLQKNKVNKVLSSPNLYLVETVHSEKLAKALDSSCQKLSRSDALRIMVQVNTSSEENKSGCDPAEVGNLVQFIQKSCPSLQFTGLMTIGSFDHNISQGPNPDFQLLRRCREDVCRDTGIAEDSVELSMGMSHDFQHAIELGSTNVRVGSTIFGARVYPSKS